MKTIVDTLREADEYSFAVFLTILTLLFVPDLGFGLLVRVEGMPQELVLNMAFVYLVAFYIIVPIILITYGKRMTRLLFPFLVGFTPFLAYFIYMLLKLPFFIPEVHGHRLILGSLAGLMGVSANMYARAKHIGLPLLIAVLIAWILLTMIPLILIRALMYFGPPIPPPPPPPPK